MIKSLVKRLLLKSILFAAVVVGWLYYYNSAVITQLPVSNINLTPIETKDLSVDKIKDAVSNLGEKIQEKSSLENQPTRVYKWRDAQGSLHVSNTPPAGVDNVQVQEYHPQTNIISSGNKTEDAKKQDAAGQKGSRIESYKELVDKARQTRENMEQRNRDLDSFVTQ